MFWGRENKNAEDFGFQLKTKKQQFKSVETKPHVTITGRSNPEGAGSIHRDCINLQAQIPIFRYTFKFPKCLHTCAFMDFT